MMNIFVIGDVHGCFNTLRNLIKKIPHNAEIIFVGDLCDRGKYTKEVIEFVIQNNYRCIKGNHEKYMINYLEDVLFKNKDGIGWLKDGWGGAATVDNYRGEDSALIQRHLSWLETLPSFLLIKNKYFITHGYGLPYFKRKEIDDEKIRHALMSNRIDDNKYKSYWEDTSTYDVINIFGHCKFEEVLSGENYYGIDTGCSYGNKLTAIELGSMQVIDEPLDDNDIFIKKIN